MKRILILNGPNLNLLGVREPSIYGKENFESFFEALKNKYREVEFSYFQSNIEGELINKLQEVGFNYDGIIFNAGGYTHTSVAIADTIASISSPVIEVHISNVYKRESYRQTSLMAKNCKGIISGFGLDSYRIAVSGFVNTLI